MIKVSTSQNQILERSSNDTASKPEPNTVREVMGSSATVTATANTIPCAPTPTESEDAWNFDWTNISNILVEAKRLKRETNQERRELEAREAEVGPLLPLLPLIKRLENLGLHEVDLGPVLETWLDVIREIMETDGVDYENATARLNQELSMLRDYRNLVWLQGFKGSWR